MGFNNTISKCRELHAMRVLCVLQNDIFLVSFNMAVFTVIMISYTAYMRFLCLILCICFYLSCTERHSEAKMQMQKKNVLSRKLHEIQAFVRPLIKMRKTCVQMSSINESFRIYQCVFIMPAPVGACYYLVMLFCFSHAGLLFNQWNQSMKGKQQFNPFLHCQIKVFVKTCSFCIFRKNHSAFVPFMFHYGI